ncbi:hypothetical protein EVAR_67396_1 [Eumeta japonica]|uniref:Uncharacterized protein n=1 Tax=Eumeta variegata TaxID=151549 RepID=A0A4C1ZXE0_EUMVA|nr:hypothetical protein EVAR_67396_1 [Eumeta japonica]
MIQYNTIVVKDNWVSLQICTKLCNDFLQSGGREGGRGYCLAVSSIALRDGAHTHKFIRDGFEPLHCMLISPIELMAGARCCPDMGRASDDRVGGAPGPLRRPVPISAGVGFRRGCGMQASFEVVLTTLKFHFRRITYKNV